MDLHEALYTTRAMRRVRPDPIPVDVQARILDAAVRAPVGRQPAELALPAPRQHSKSSVITFVSILLTFYDDYVNRQEILDKLPATIREALYPTEPDTRLCIIPQQKSASGGVLSERSVLPERYFAQRNNNYISREVNRSLGSNNWVVGSGLSDSGQLFLCNDLHLFLTTPNIFL